MVFDWNDEKNEFLKQVRGVSFEEIILFIEEGGIVDIIENPNKEEYPNQMIYLVNRNNYIFAVPFVVDNKRKVIFLKTIFPSRYYTKKYLKEAGDE